MERIELMDTGKILDVRNSCLDGSRFECVRLEQLRFVNVSMAGTRITDANLSDLEIDGAQLGGAYIHNIGLPPEGHPNFIAGAKQKPVKFDNCNLEGSQITDSNLSLVEITDCNLDGMKINGILVTELLKAFENAP